MSFGIKLRQLRLDNELPLRKVAAYLDIDASVLSKIERSERCASRDVVLKAAEYFEVNKEELLTSFYSDQIANLLENEINVDLILSEAEMKVKKLKQNKLEQENLNFGNEK